MKVIEYAVIWGEGNEFLTKVNNLLKQGWQPWGGVAQRPWGVGGSILFQAMVKYEE